MGRMLTLPRWAFALAFVVVTGAALRAERAVHHGAFLSTDERAYAALGRALSHGYYDVRGMNDPLHWPPGTPLLFAVARKLTGVSDATLTPAAAYWAQALVGVALIVVVFLLVRLLAGPWPGVVAAACVALYPPLVVITGDMVSEPLGALTIGLVMLALAWAWRAETPAPWRFAVAGALTGVAILVRADLLILPLVLAVVVAPACVALYPPLVVITGDMVSEPLGALTIALVVLALAWAWRAETPAPWRFAVAGALTGVAILVRADLLILPLVLAVVVALTLRRTGARRALLPAGAYLLAAVLALAPWSIYATGRRQQLTPITSSSWSGLYVGTYLPADGRIFRLREKLGDAARAHNPKIRDVENENLRTEWILDAVAARHPDLGRSDALQRETLRNLRRYALGRPVAFAGMQARKLERMWIGYDRGTHHKERAWILAIHLLLSAAGFAGLLYGLWRTRHPALWAILATVLTVTAVNSFFVSEARHNVRIVPLLVAGGVAGVAMARVTGRGRAERSEPPRADASARVGPRVERRSTAGAAR